VLGCTEFPLIVDKNNSALPIINPVELQCTAAVDFALEKTFNIKNKINLENIIATLPGHIYWLDTNNIFLGCNNLQAKTIGLHSRYEIIGKTIHEFQTHENATRIIKNNNMVMKTGQTQIFEEPYMKSDGSIVIYLSHKTPLKDDNGNIIGILGVSFEQEKNVL
jgi:PAS domain S-box-containing protein